MHEAQKKQKKSNPEVGEFLPKNVEMVGKMVSKIRGGPKYEYCQHPPKSMW